MQLRLKKSKILEGAGGRTEACGFRGGGFWLPVEGGDEETGVKGRGLWVEPEGELGGDSTRACVPDPPSIELIANFP